MSDSVPKVLVVDDSQEITDLIYNYCLHYDKEFVTIVTNQPEHVLRILEENQDLRLIVTDFRMPAINGLELIIKVKDRFPGIQFIMMTGYGTPELRRQVEERGVFHYLEKPFRINALIKLIQDVLSRPAAKGFDGFVPSLQLPDIIQLIAIGNGNATLEITAGVRQGKIYFQSGQIVHADCGTRTGKEAFYEMFLWGSGRFVVSDPPPEIPQTISDNWQGMLLEAARLEDEQRARMAEHPLEAPRPQPPAPKPQPTAPIPQTAPPKPAEPRVRATAPVSDQVPDSLDFLGSLEPQPAAPPDEDEGLIAIPEEDIASLRPQFEDPQSLAAPSQTLPQELSFLRHKPEPYPAPESPPSPPSPARIETALPQPKPVLEPFVMLPKAVPLQPAVEIAPSDSFSREAAPAVPVAPRPAAPSGAVAAPQGDLSREHLVDAVEGCVQFYMRQFPQRERVALRDLPIRDMVSLLRRHLKFYFHLTSTSSFRFEDAPFDFNNPKVAKTAFDFLEALLETWEFTSSQFARILGEATLFHLERSLNPGAALTHFLERHSDGRARRMSTILTSMLSREVIEKFYQPLIGYLDAQQEQEVSSRDVEKFILNLYRRGEESFGIEDVKGAIRRVLEIYAVGRSGVALSLQREVVVTMLEARGMLETAGKLRQVLLYPEQAVPLEVLDRIASQSR